jgi:transcriptional regulator GlxA family with amidase domain
MLVRSILARSRGAHQLISERQSPPSDRRQVPVSLVSGGDPNLLQLIRLAALLFSSPLARERLLRAAPITRLQVERMLLDVLDDVFLLYFPLEAAERALDRLAFLYLDFSQA